MPNWCENKVIIKGDSALIKDFLKKYFDKNNEFDFGLVVPEPTKVEDCPKDCLTKLNSHIQEDAERPWFDWYEWHCKFWGTKWNSCDTALSLSEDETVLYLWFNTAWSPCHPVIDKLRVLEPKLKIKHYFLETGMGIAGYTCDGRYVSYEPGSSSYRSFMYRFYNN